MKVSVVIPSYNERENIADAVRRVESALGEALLEVIVVDDDSPDRSWEVVERLNDPRCRLIRRMDKRGLASALADGTAAARGDVVVWIDCDMGVPPEVIPRLVEKIGPYDIAIGSRYAPGGRDERAWWRSGLSTLFNFYAALVLGFKVRDYTSGFAAVKRDVIRQEPLPPEGFGDYFVEWAYRCMKRGFRIVEIGYVYTLRQKGVSKTDGNLFTFFRFGLYYCLRVLKTRLKG